MAEGEESAPVFVDNDCLAQVGRAQTTSFTSLPLALPLLSAQQNYLLIPGQNKKDAMDGWGSSDRDR